MVAEGDMNNRVVQPAEGPREAETFVVDLTSVCLRSGTVRLPLSLIGRFSEGQHRVTAGGEELMIEFEAPRSLLGLASFFERTELKANDRVRFVFDGQHLALEAHKRERTKTGRVAEGPLRPGVNVAQALQVSEKPSGQARLTTRGVFPAPSELVDDSALRAQSQSATPSQSAATDDDPAGAEAAPGANAGTVRRVRIEGGPAPRTDTVAPRPLDRASAHEVWARRQQPAWRALDTMVAGPVVPPDEAAEAFSESTVRVVRRSKGTSIPLEVEAPPLPKPAPEAAPETRAPFSYSMSWPLPETTRKQPAARPADGPLTRASQAAAPSEAPAEPIAAASKPQFDPYLDAPIDADREEHYTPPTILESDLLAIPSAGKWRAESEEAFHKYQEDRVLASAEPVPVPAERRQGLLGRLGLGRSARIPAEQGSRPSAPRPEKAQGSEPVPVSAAPVELTRPEQERQPDLPDLPAAGEVGVLEFESPDPDPNPGSSEKRVIVDESVYDVDFDTEVQPQLGAAQVSQDSLEADMAKLRSYLAQPDVPAIVRCDDLAARLQISQERVSSAMYRLSEDRERYTPLRGDAYMVRRAR